MGVFEFFSKKNGTLAGSLLVLHWILRLSVLRHFAQDDSVGRGVMPLTLT